jgi:hypothetical protein
VKSSFVIEFCSLAEDVSLFSSFIRTYSFTDLPKCNGDRLRDLTDQNNSDNIDSNWVIFKCRKKFFQDCRTKDNVTTGRIERKLNKVSAQDYKVDSVGDNPMLSREI